MGSSLHHFFIHLVPYALAGKFAPLHAAQLIIVSHKPTFLTDHLCVHRKNLDHMQTPTQMLMLMLMQMLMSIMTMIP